MSSRRTVLPLYWKVCLINGAVFSAALLLLALSPLSLSRELLASELLVLAGGLLLILSVNALLLWSSLGPIDRLARFVESPQALESGRRVSESGAGTGAALVRSFNGMLDRLESERDTSKARAVAAQEAERTRIAQELHDEVGQSLTVVLLGLGRATEQAPPDIAEELAQMRESVRSSIDEVRRVVAHLRPGVLEDLGLVSALMALAADLESHSPVRVRRGFAPGLPPLEAEVELVLYRVAQESLTNVARHSGASTVDLRLGQQGRSVVLSVADDGRGLRSAPPGTGLRGMRERALLVGGELWVGAREGGGTEVRLRVPDAGGVR